MVTQTQIEWLKINLSLSKILSVLWIRISIKSKGRMRIRIWIRVKVISWIRIRIKVISWIRILINFQMTSQNAWNMSLFEHFFKVLSLYLEASIRIRIKVTSKNWIRIRIKVKYRIRISIKVMWISNTNFLYFRLVTNTVYGTEPLK